MSEIRTRFAPSPTGFLHIGGVRTAIFSWAFARHHAGKFILRIEDTDQGRSTREATQTILEGLSWLKLDYDEGPYFQSKRFDKYQNALDQLLKTNNAYRCYCSSERLASLRDSQIAQKQKPRYDGQCRYHQKRHLHDEPFVVRFKNPTEGHVIVKDKVLGDVCFNNSELDDFILARSDGTPTYNFTVVVDDCDLAITHVIRGNDHLNNTPRQINVLKALKAPIPVYLHLPMIHSNEGKKLSKREGAASVIDYKLAGFLPEAVVNYLIRLGWSHGDQEIFSYEEMIRYFDGEHLSKSPAILNLEKFFWVNQQFLKSMPSEKIAEAMQPFTKDWNLTKGVEPFLTDVVVAQRNRVKTLKEMAEQSRFFYEMPVLQQSLLLDELKPALKHIRLQLNLLKHWEKSKIYEILTQTVKQYNLKTKYFFQTLRILLTGATISPPLDITMELLGKKRVLERLAVSAD